MSLLWNIFNTMQVILAFPLLKVKIPANILQVKDTFEKMINFDVFPKDKIYDMTLVKVFKFESSA